MYLSPLLASIMNTYGHVKYGRVDRLNLSTMDQQYHRELPTTVIMAPANTNFSSARLDGGLFSMK